MKLTEHGYVAIGIDCGGVREESYCFNFDQLEMQVRMMKRKYPYVFYREEHTYQVKGDEE